MSAQHNRTNTCKPTKRQLEALSKKATKLLETALSFDDWCRLATPAERAAVEASHPGGARGFYDEHVARLKAFASLDPRSGTD